MQALLGTLSVFIVAVASIGQAAGASDPRVVAILAENRAAVGDPPPGHAAVLTYRYSGSGLVGRMTERVDLTTGAYVDSTVASGLSEGNGFDGRTPWQQDISGSLTPQEGGDRIPAAIAAAYRRANLWWRADQSGAAVVYVGRERDDSGSLEHLLVTPRGGKPFDAWFNHDTHFLMRVRYDEEFYSVTERYSDYERTGPQMLARRIERDPGMGAQAVTHLVLLNCTYLRATPLSDYAQPNTPLTGAAILGASSRATIPFRLLNNHIYLDAKVDGKGPYTFILDTGGHTLLSPRLIKEVGLKPIGAAVTSGAGEGHGSTGFVYFSEIAIGTVRLRNQYGFATDIYDKAIEGIPVDGMVGFELVRRMVTTIDYGRHLITFTRPDLFKAGPDTGVPVPFVFYDHLPNVEGTIGEVPAHFNIDTGSRSALDITSPFVAKHQLREHFPNGVNAVTGYGVGGATRSYVVRMPSVTIGHIPMQHLVVGFSDSRSGSFSDPSYDGNVGSGLLKQFVVTFDYAHQFMYLKRIEPPPPDINTFDRSGLWINAHGDGYAVVEVGPLSAAARAGLAVGDLITRMDGHAVTDAGLSNARERLRTAPAGTRIPLLIQRGSQALNFTLVLQDQV